MRTATKFRIGEIGWRWSKPVQKDCNYYKTRGRSLPGLPDKHVPVDIVNALTYRGRSSQLFGFAVQTVQAKDTRMFGTTFFGGLVGLLAAFSSEDSLQVSEAVRVGDVEFRAVTTPKCIVSSDRADKWFKVGFRITNRGKNPLRFELFETFTPILRSADGNEIDSEYEREETCPMDPVLIGPGRTKTILLRAALLSWPEKGPHLLIDDDSGGGYVFEGIVPGKHRLSFRYSNSLGRFGFTSERKGMPPFWLGDIATREVEFQIAMPAKQ